LNSIIIIIIFVQYINLTERKHVHNLGLTYSKYKS